jgi:hypothetical protein
MSAPVPSLDILRVFLPIIKQMQIVIKKTEQSNEQIITIFNENEWKVSSNGTVRIKKFKQLFENQHLLLLRNIWWSKF